MLVHLSIWTWPAGPTLQTPCCYLMWDRAAGCLPGLSMEQCWLWSLLMRPSLSLVLHFFGHILYVIPHSSLTRSLSWTQHLENSETSKARCHGLRSKDSLDMFLITNRTGSTDHAMPSSQKLQQRRAFVMCPCLSEFGHKGEYTKHRHRARLRVISQLDLFSLKQ